MRLPMSSSPWTFLFNGDVWHQDEVIQEAGEYLQARGQVILLAYDNFTAVILKDPI